MDSRKLWISENLTLDLNFVTHLTIALFVIYVVYKDLSEEKFNKNGIKTFNNKKDFIPFPNGWIPIIESRDIRTNQSKTVRALGYELVVCRKDAEEVYVITEIRIPNVLLIVWQTVEMNGFIYVWYHSFGEKPDWYPTKTQAIDDLKLVYRGRIEYTVNGSLQDFMENAAELMHLNVVDGIPSHTVPDLIKRIFYNIYANVTNNVTDIEWKPADEQHKALLTISSKLSIFGYPLIESTQIVEQIGPNCFIGVLGKSVFHVFIIPVESKKCRVIGHLYLEETFIGRLFSELIISEWIHQTSRDISFWNNNKYFKNCALHKSDKAMFRSWFSQFYSKSCFKMRQDLEW